MIFIDTLLGKKTHAVPFWFMRQAGRYLPEYKAVRSKFPDFLGFCYTPDAACEVTLQPIRKFGMSAAIIFSDILVIPDALGMEVAFRESVGPVLVPLKNERNIASLNPSAMEEKLAPVYQAIRLTRKELPTDTALIGFCGSPWTLACYMIQGKSSRDFEEARKFAFTNPGLFLKIMDLLTASVAEHAISQIEAGANAIQLFDSWSGVLSEKEFSDYVIEPTKKIVAVLKQKYPQVPVIGFPRMAGAKTAQFAKEVKVDAISFDGSVSHEFAKEQLLPKRGIQGNLDSLMLAENKEEALNQTRLLLRQFAGEKYIFNLAHGILPHTPVGNVQAVCDMIKAN